MDAAVTSLKNLYSFIKSSSSPNFFDQIFHEMCWFFDTVVWGNSVQIYRFVIHHKLFDFIDNELSVIDTLWSHSLWVT